MMGKKVIVRKPTFRWISLVFVLALVAAACGGDSSGDGTTTVPGTDEATTTTAAPEPETTTTQPAEPSSDFEGLSVAAPDCDYGGKVSSITAVDEFTVEFAMCAPVPAFQQIAAFTPFGIQPEEHLQATGGSPLDSPVGTGPFVLDSWNRGDSVVYSANADYWGTPPAFDTLVIRWATESAQRLVELQSGNVDYITNLATDDIATVEADDSLQLLPDLNPNVLYLGMANTIAPFDNIEIRQALAQGIDRQRIIDNFYPIGSSVPTHFTPCAIPNACVGEDWYEYNPTAAKDLIDANGGGFDVTIYYRDVFRVYLPEPGAVAQDIAEQLRENLGINATVQVVESGEFIAESTQGNYGLYLLGWGADYPHITNFLDFHFGEANPQFGDAHPEIYEALQEASTIADPATAEPLYETANNAIRELVPMVPLAWGAAADAALGTLQDANNPQFGAPQFELTNPGKDTLVFMQNAEPISLFCADETDGESLSACQYVVEPLLGYDLAGGVVPKLATGCEANDDATVWTCTLRTGVTFHDGSTFDANDVVASYALGLDASNPLHVGNTGTFDYYAYLWDNLINAEG
jgi:ABC-type transport system substrate-binding protein